MENTGCGKPGVWKTRGVENTESGGKHGVSVENTGSKWKTRGVTKNYCVTWIIRVYANLVQKLREYLISLCHGD